MSNCLTSGIDKFEKAKIEIQEKILNGNYSSEQTEVLAGSFFILGSINEMLRKLQQVN